MSIIFCVGYRQSVKRVVHLLAGSEAVWLSVKGLNTSDVFYQNMKQLQHQCVK